MKDKNYIIITAGGTGKRMGADLPKQFLKLSGKPILMHTIMRFYNYNKNYKIIISLPKEYIKTWKDLCTEYNFSIIHKVVEGGKTRFYSIKNALKKVSGEGFVAVHDGVRPLLSKETIKRTFEKAEEKGNAVASSNIQFSIRKKVKDGTIALNRDLYKEIQTPQVFKISILKKAYKQEYQENFTDDASLVEKNGEKIYLTEGNIENIKITTPQDIKIAEVLLNAVI